MVIRLINTDTRRLDDFVGDQVPEYAILSHTWGDDEISLHEMSRIIKDPDHRGRNKSGYKKILKTCAIAKEHDIGYVWVDTCCIDKSSSAELTEAINSMYKWYQNAKVCYVWLSDFDVGSKQRSMKHCRWFTRGWCLQELIAPSKVTFYDREWGSVGTKQELAELICEITRVDKEILTGESCVSSLPMARKMSWAAGRKTSRPEDTAYCLLGLMDVNMPLVYGEGGHKAFVRLQEQIIKNSNDLSIFAFPKLLAPWDTGKRKEEKEQNFEADGLPYCNLFAESPGDFKGSEKFEFVQEGTLRNQAFILTNNGLYFPRIELQVDEAGCYRLRLNCRGTGGKLIYEMLLRKVEANLFTRLGGYGTSSKSRFLYQEITEVYIIPTVTPLYTKVLRSAEDYAIRICSKLNQRIIEETTPRDRWDSSRMQFLTREQHNFECSIRLSSDLIYQYGMSVKSKVAARGRPPLYAVCGYTGYGESSKGWIRLLTEANWEQMMKKRTKMNEMAKLKKFNRFPRTISNALVFDECRISAQIKLIESGRPYFEVRLGFEPEARFQRRKHICHTRSKGNHDVFDTSREKNLESSEESDSSGGRGGDTDEEDTLVNSDEESS